MAQKDALSALMQARPLVSHDLVVAWIQLLSGTRDSIDSTVFGSPKASISGKLFLFFSEILNRFQSVALFWLNNVTCRGSVLLFWSKVKNQYSHIDILRDSITLQNCESQQFSMIRAFHCILCLLKGFYLIMPDAFPVRAVNLRRYSQLPGSFRVPTSPRKSFKPILTRKCACSIP